MRCKIVLVFLVAVTCSCSVSRTISKSAKEVLLNPALANAHVGISIYEPATGKYWFNHQADKYFIPASNVKIPTCYAAMKYLGDSLVGLRYGFDDDDEALYITGTGDPTLLLDEFKYQPVFQFLNNSASTSIKVVTGNWRDQMYGSGWSWNDFDQNYMLEKSPMPVYGNKIYFFSEGIKLRTYPSLYEQGIPHDLNKVGFEGKYDVVKQWGSNHFLFTTRGDKIFKEKTLPMTMNGYSEAIYVLQDTLKKAMYYSLSSHKNNFKRGGIIYSQPTNAVLKPMMHRSDNFFAEQLLLMVSNEMLGIMNDEKIIDTILKTDFKDLPQKPRWADGSGLSRYNLFTPQDFVMILSKMKTGFPMERIKEIFPTGGQGTLSNYYKSDSSFIYAKTGTLSGVVALSGFLYTQKGKELIFSILVNNHNRSATDIRRAVEKFIQELRKRY